MHLDRAGLVATEELSLDADLRRLAVCALLQLLFQHTPNRLVRQR
jgi:hypothetical protein